MTKGQKMLVLFFLLQLLAVLCQAEGSCNNQYTEIMVSLNGSDNVSCHSCFSLQYVLTTLQLNNCTKVTIYDNQTISLTVTIKNINGLLIQGGSDHVSVTINENSHLVLVNSTNIELNMIKWINGDQSSVRFVYCSNLTISNCTFMINTNSEHGLILENVGYIVKIYNCYFNNRLSSISGTNTTKLLDIMLFDTLVSDSFYSITHCFFQGISNSEILDSGLTFIIQHDVNNVNLEIENSTFKNNDGLIGGGAYIDIHSFSTNNRVFIRNCTFIENGATKLGGGLYIGVRNQREIQSLPNELNFTIVISSCLFFNNSATHAGAVAFQTIGQLSTVAKFGNSTICDTIFKQNHASKSGAVLGFFKWENGLGGVTPSVKVINCSVINNTIHGLDIKSPAHIIGSGAIYTQGVPIDISGNTKINTNYGTAILASSTVVYFAGNVTFENNIGIRGGVFNLIGGSRIVVEKGLNLTFYKNVAELYGGVIYHVFPVLGVVGQNEYCTIQYSNASIVDPSKWDANIWFINNTALNAGQSIYISSIDSCFKNNENKIFTERNTFHFLPSYEKQIMTPPINITFNSSSSSFHCIDNLCEVDAMLGEQITISVQALDIFNQPVNSFASIELACTSKLNEVIHSVYSTHCQYALNGINVMELSGTPTKVPFYIKGNNVMSTVILVWKTIQEPSTRAYLKVNIVNCYLGYVYDSHKEMCTCYNKSSDTVACNETDYTACVKSGYWYGAIEIDSQETFGILQCPFGFCNYTIGGQCPTEPCGGDGSAYQFYCTLPKYDSDGLCLFERGGPLCSECSQNHSFSFDTIQCVPDSQCHNGYLALNIFLNLIFLGLIISAILIIARLNLRIGSGKLYCLVFYFSVLQFFVRGMFPSFFLFVIELIFTGFIQLNPKMFGLMNTCTNYAIDNANIIYSTLHYAGPIFLIFVVSLMIWVSWKWPKYALFSNSNIGVNVICIILYISFISFSQTSLSVLTPVKFPESEETLVSLNPNVRYFDPKNHLPFALIALLIQVFLVIPFLILLLFSPCLIRIKKLKLTKMKPIIDEFQACYKEKYRSFAGYYLTFRQLIFIVDLLNLGLTNSIYILQILSIIVLTIHCLVQPYKSTSLNILDGLLILDLVLLSILHGNTANLVFDDILPLKTALVHILVLLPVLYLIVICAIPLYNTCCTTKVKRFFRFNKKIKLPVSGSIIRRPTETNPPVTSTTVTIDDITEQEKTNRDENYTLLVDPLEREPLLFLQSVHEFDYQSNQCKSHDYIT